jgi:hypothetical protein
MGLHDAQLIFIDVFTDDHINISFSNESQELIV